MILMPLEGGWREILSLSRKISRIYNIEFRSTCLREAASAKAGEIPAYRQAGETNTNVRNTNDRNVNVFELEHLNFGFACPVK